ncbi:hypothetical protein VTK73DRAFT_9409 [Phialemonium thermophilum]|uniref:non-specific serine/threonine protein kinase n=1 Tax=Phialemonium thermophilum TaxID=223376 RepID=A0ABR3XLA3_9PEZI
MWMIRPWMEPREIKIDLPAVIVDSLGSGAQVLASYLTQLAETGMDDPARYPPPLPLLCRICERQIPPWWFEKHTDLCLQEHRAEMEVQMAQESLTDHRHAIVKVLDALEVRRSRSLTGDATSLPVAEYKGLPIGPPASTSSSPGTSSPTPSASSGSSTTGRSRERSSGLGHSRGRSFAVRRPQVRIVELLLDLCDTALEISPPAIKESSQTAGEFRTQSPQSESRIFQVMQWETPGTNTLEQEQGLSLLCADTERLAKAKVEAVMRHRKILEYAERIRVEFTILVQECISEAIRKAARIAAGRLSDSTEDEEEQSGPSHEEAFFAGSFDAPPSALAMALENAHIEEDPDRRRLSSIVDSSTDSPRECPTPRSNRGPLSTATVPSRDSRRGSIMFESDAGESDGSIRSSSIASRPPPRTESPISEFGDLRRQASSRQHSRRSLILPGSSSPRRQESPSRTAHQPSSPLRIQKPRSLPFPSNDGITSPEASPMLTMSEFSSPALPHHHHHHHRRQSSAAVSAGNGEFPIKPPPSPRLSAVVSAPQARAVPPSIKDFEIIKPISKGAFGSVYLSKKKSTAEYFAIKVLKKADMVAKNQVTNVKAERAIMMWQGESDFVAKLYWTFSSKDYLYLVMEYLNGGDCASLIKVLGGLPEDWVKKYLGEVVLGVEHLHSRGIVHRDLKPDNLLIDQKGHLKLTDFGLSRMGLIGRQKRALNSGTDAAPDLLKQGPFARSASLASSRSTSLDLHAARSNSPISTPQMTPSDFGAGLGPPSYFNLGSVTHDSRRVSGQRSDSGGSDALAHMLSNFSLNDSPAGVPSQAVQSPLGEVSEGEGGISPDFPALHHTSTQNSFETGRGTPPQANMPPPNWALFDPEDTNRRFVGTPDYLAPETIKGEPQDETSDWWSVGCIMFEFLYGIPPFHASEAEQVFENILARRIQWPDDNEIPVSPEAKDLINQLLCMDPRQRLGANREEKYQSGGEEIRNHPWFHGVNWETLLQDEAQFVPQPENPEDTEYFDSRGAVLQSFAEEIEDQTSQPSASAQDYPDRPHDALSRVRSQANSNSSSIKRGLMPLHIPPHVRDLKSRRLSEPVATDDFGNFAFKNLPVLEKANKDVIQKLRAETLAAQSKQSALTPGGLNSVTSPGPSLDGSPALSIPVQRTLSNAKASQRPQSPSGLSHANSSPSRASQPSSPLLVSFVAGQGAEGRRKASSNSSSLSQPSSQPLLPGNNYDVPRVPPSLQKAATTVAASSPIKLRPMPASPQKFASTPRHTSSSTGSRSRSLTTGSQEGSPVASDILAAHHKNRRSQVFEMSPSSSDNEGDKASALLRVQRRRQSSRRLSHVALDQPMFRPLDVLICEDHPVSRMVMEKLLEKSHCRTISAATGSEAVRYSMSDIKFDIIFMEFKLPQINGADVARMIRETKNANSHTPLVAITAYLKELQAPHYFDSLIEKPITPSKLTEVLGNLCQWKPASPGQANQALSYVPRPIPSGLRQESLRLEDSPTSGSSGYAHRSSSSFREGSIGSSLFGDSESVSTDDVPVMISRKATGDWDEGGLGISGPGDSSPGVADTLKHPYPPQFITQQSAPSQIEQSSGRVEMPVPRRSFEKLRAKRESIEKRRYEGSVDSADDEDDELGLSPNSYGTGSGSGSSSGSAVWTAPGSSVSGSGSNSGSLVRQHFRSKSILPSSKLGIEMMRANSHDSVTMTRSESTSTIEPTTQVATPSWEISADQCDLKEAPEPKSPTDRDGKPVVFRVRTPPEPAASDNGRALATDVDETPRPNPAVDRGGVKDEEPTPRPSTRLSAS